MRTSAIKRPQCFAGYDGNWAIQLGTNYDQLPAQVLLGVDSARVFPVNVTHPNGSPVQTHKCRLLRSVLTGRFLMSRSAELDDQMEEVDFPSSLNVNLIGAASLETQLEEFHQAFVEDVVNI